MTMLSIGMEKLFKMTLGVMSLDETHAWPSKQVMRGYGHGVTDLFDEAMRGIRSRTANSTGYVKGLVEHVDEDPVLPPLLETLDRYGKAGRFYNLDLLADDPQTEADPKHLWEQAERAVMSDPDIAASFSAAMSDTSNNEVWDAFHASVQTRLAEGIEACWNMVSRVGINHALGTTGSVLGWEIAPTSVGRQ